MVSIPTPRVAFLLVVASDENESYENEQTLLHGGDP
jgi:hypothetical protein